MMNIFISGMLCFLTLQASAEETGYLQECWNRQVAPLAGQYMAFSYQETLNELEHNFEPWQQTHYTGKGTVWYGMDSFLRADTLAEGESRYFSKTWLSSADLLLMEYGTEKLFPVTKGMFLEQCFKSARYSPVPLLSYFFRQKAAPDKESDREFVVYKATIHKAIVRLYIRRSDSLLFRATVWSYDELLGDVESTFTYSDFAKAGRLLYPATIRVEKINGRLKDEVKVHVAQLVSELPRLLEKPAGYRMEEEKEEPAQVSVEKYSSNIHFLEVKHTDDRVLVAEFRDFLLVEGAPLSSKNGELVIRSIREKISPKPVKYFTFGHYHPHYLGGMRAFIHKGATVLSVKSDEEYVRYLADASHSLNPDSLHLQPRPLRLEEIRDSTTITDGKFGMKIYVIGKKSAHTNDYLIYYFPQEKLLFEDDLVWIPREGPAEKAGERQAGLYNAIKELGLDVRTIVQSWPVADYGVKTVIPFEELEKSMGVN
jgi:glyoxylase-like metal-dependent hydrolase (beta-lactamase superfamily II)